MSSHLSSMPRHSMNARQADTVAGLLAAARELVDDVGHERLTIRMVAASAGVSPATAYTYFASKDHLFAEMFWRLVSGTPAPVLSGSTAKSRLQQTMRQLAGLIAEAPALTAAVTRSLLGSDPEVQRLRVAIGSAFVERFSAALGDDADRQVVLALVFAFNGAMLQSGMGLLTQGALADQLDSVVEVVMGDNR